MIKILVVEDMSDILTTVAGTLSDQGYLVSTAGNQSEALEKLNQDRFDLVISDIGLEGSKFEDEDESGIELAKTISEHYIDSAVILITGNPVRERYVTIAIKYNIIGFVEKKLDWMQRTTAIIEEFTKNKPVREVLKFFENAGFQIDPGDLSGFVALTEKPVWRELPRVYVRLVLDRSLDLDEFQKISQLTKQIFRDQNSKQIVFVIIDRLPEISDLHQIYALRAQQDFLVIPLSLPEIGGAIRELRESEYLHEQVSLYTGQTNHFDAHTEVSDALSFFGRHAILQNIEQGLLDGKSAILFGVRKIGKSSLLARLRHVPQWTVAKLDIQGYMDGLSYAYIEIVRAWQRELVTMYPVLALPDWEQQINTVAPSDRTHIFRQAVRSFIDLASDQAGFQGLFLFVDEVDMLFEHPDYFNFAGLLRSLSEDPYLKGRFSLLLAGLDPQINRVDSMPKGRNPFFSFFQEYSVGPLSREDAFTMIVALGSPMGITFADEALQLLVDAGGCHPFLTRQLCSYAIKGKTRPVTISLDEAIHGIESYLSNPENYLAETLWSLPIGGPPEPEAQILKVLATQQSCFKEELIANKDEATDLHVQELALRHLSDHCIIRENELGKWEITIPIYSHWIRRNILNLSINLFPTSAV